MLQGMLQEGDLHVCSARFVRLSVEETESFLLHHQVPRHLIGGRDVTSMLQVRHGRESGVTGML